jgi:alpha-glucosidase (family GH31 glycosyl hydrolase)
MWIHYPADQKAVALGNQYLWGRDLLIAPVFEKGAKSRTTYLPEGLWHDWWSGEVVKGGKDVVRNVDLSIMPIYVRAGAIIPVDPVRQYTGETVSAPTTIKIFTESDGRFTLYEDDGISLEYLHGVGRWTGFKWSEKERTLTIQPAPPAGAVNKFIERELILELRPEGKTRRVRLNGRTQLITFQEKI